METAHAKFGIRFALLVLLVVIVGIPAIKVAINKVNAPQSVKDWINSI